MEHRYDEGYFDSFSGEEDYSYEDYEGDFSYEDDFSYEEYRKQILTEVPNKSTFPKSLTDIFKEGEIR